jgi:hypothetical protein
MAWLGGDGRPDALPATPLLLDDAPAVAYSYAYRALALRIATSPSVAIIASDPRMTASGWEPVAVVGKPRLIEDPDGVFVAEKILSQELRKFPPSRAFVDSIMLRTENWWYVPRLIIVLDRVTAIGVAARSTADQVLAVRGSDGLFVDTVSVQDSSTDERQVTSLRDQTAPPGPAVLLGHDFSEPDLERWTPWVTRGHLSDGVLRVDERPDRTSLEPVPKLRERYRRHRELKRACIAELAK